ncbi:MAG: dipeptide epimerase [Epsilonproteobacteria bacterium]|nr:dipeptide epimerase [Campylobacterota bacterium]
MKKIVSIETRLIYIELKTPFITALRRVEEVELIRVCVTYDDGSISLGEAPSTKAITNEDVSSISLSISKIKDKLISLSPKEALKALHLTSIGSSAKALLDMALFDFRCSGFKSIKTDITISFNHKEKMLLDAKDAINHGTNILKVKLAKDIYHAIEVTKELSKLDAVLLIDANQAWSLKDTFIYLDAVQNLDIKLIEQPVQASNLNDLKTITAYSNIPILADEAVFTLEDAKKVIESKSADMINIKLMKCGGVSKAIEILEYAREMGVKCMLGSMLEGPISINKALHLAFAYDDVVKYVDLDSPLLYKEPSEELEFRFVGCEIFKK